MDMVPLKTLHHCLVACLLLVILTGYSSCDGVGGCGIVVVVVEVMVVVGVVIMMVEVVVGW
jgi:hypothetical protein